MVDLTGGNWDPTWTDAQQEFASPWKTKTYDPTGIDENEEGDGKESPTEVEGEADSAKGDGDWSWCHDGERWWVGCPKAMSQEQVMASWGCGTEKAIAAPAAAKPHENDTNTGDVKGLNQVEPKETPAEVEPKEVPADPKESIAEVEPKEVPAKTEGELKESPAEVEPKEVEPKTDTPSEPEVTPAKPESATATKASKRKTPEAGDVLWKPLTQAGYADFLDSCSGCGRDVHDPPEAFLHPTAPERSQETKVVWRPCTHTGVATFNRFFGQVEPEKMHLKELITYVHGLDGDWTLIPSTTPGFVVEIAKYISALRFEWGVVELQDVDFWMRQRCGCCPQTRWLFVSNTFQKTPPAHRFNTSPGQEPQRLD